MAHIGDTPFSDGSYCAIGTICRCKRRGSIKTDFIPRLMIDQGLMISTQVETVLTEFMERKKQYLSDLNI